MAPSYYPHSSRDRFVEPPSVFNRVLLALPKDLAVSLRRMADQGNFNRVSARIPIWLRQVVVRECNWRRLFSLPHLLVAIWTVALMYGERWVFEKSVQECAWDNWERWVSYMAARDREDHEADMNRIYPAFRFDAAPLDISCGSSTHRCTFISRSAMAFVDTDDMAYG
jgi:hypothetical protein